MRVEAMVMAEMVVMILMAVVVAAHPGIGIEHARIDVHHPGLGRMRGPARAMGHRRRHHKHGSRQQRGGNSLQHVVSLLISRVAGRMAGFVDHGLEASGHALNPS